MLELQTVRSPLDPHIVTVGEINMTEEEITETELEISKKIINDFLFHVIQDTFVSKEPETTFKYNIPLMLNSKEIFRLVKSNLYNVFNHNVYAMPFVSYHSAQPGDNNLVNNVIIEASNTVESILASDERIDRSLKKLIHENFEKLEKGEKFSFDGLTISLFELPMMYAKSRAKYIVEELNKKGYIVDFLESTGYISISYSKEKQ